MPGPRYTNYDSISRLLRGRLNLAGYPEQIDTGANSGAINALLGYGQSAADQSVDLLLVDQIAEQVEYGTIDLVLGQIYQLPFKFSSEVTKNVIKQISEQMIVSSIIATSFEGQSNIIPASDISQASTDLRRQAEYKLAQLTAGTNIFIPNTLQAPNAQMNVPQMTPLTLPGETRLSQFTQPDLLNRNYTFTGKKDTSKGESYFPGNRCNSCQGRNDDTALGSDPTGYSVCDNQYEGFEKFGI